MSAEAEVLRAAADLIAAFEKNDRAAYFACFTPDARFMFYTLDHALDSRAAYEAQWEAWINELGFHVQACASSDQHVAVYGDSAVFTHNTASRITTQDGTHLYHERETIVFHKIAGRWLAVHEHLSLVSEESSTPH